MSEFRFIITTLATIIGGALILCGISIYNEPFNIFSDDAGWLISSLAWDMGSGLSWAEQLAKDTGERGSTSLNLLLRALYSLFGLNPTLYQIAGVGFHALCTFTFFLTLCQCKLDKRISFLAAIFFLFCSMHFHAYFWMIGIQHVLSLTSILAAFMGMNFLMKKIILKKIIRPWMYSTWITFLLIASINRSSILIIDLVFSIQFIFYYLTYSRGLTEHGQKSLKRIYIISVTVASIFITIQIALGNEGHQISLYLSNLGIGGKDLPRYIKLLIYLACLITFQACIIHLVGVAKKIMPPKNSPLHIKRIVRLKKYFISIRALLPSIARENVLGVLCTLAMVFLLLSLVVVDNKRLLFPGIIQNIFSNFEGLNSLSSRWSPLRAERLESQTLSRIYWVLLDLAFYIGTLYTLLQKNKQLKLLVCCLILVISLALGYIRFTGLFLDYVPSRYAYYFTPLIAIIIAIVTVNIYSNSKLSLVRFGIFIAFIALLAVNLLKINVRLESSNKSDLFSFFPTYQSFALANDIFNLEKNRVELYFPNLEYQEPNSIISIYIPPNTSKKFPIFFNTQAYLNQNSTNQPQLSISEVANASSVQLCQNGVCQNNRLLHHFDKVQCQLNGFYLTPNLAAQRKYAFDYSSLKAISLNFTVNNPLRDALVSPYSRQLLEDLDQCFLSNSAPLSPQEIEMLGIWQAGNENILIFRKGNGLYVNSRSRGNYALSMSLDKGQAFKTREKWSRPSFSKGLSNVTYIASNGNKDLNPDAGAADFLGPWVKIDNGELINILINDRNQFVLVEGNGRLSLGSMTGKMQLGLHNQFNKIDLVGTLADDYQSILWNRDAPWRRPTNAELVSYSIAK